ncbi:MAG: SCP2 sterol-binding domain-containing protein [Alphaproteobacteria bacterium]|nr:SCP2 sterol-binding domain-containing protein [Alphaproteobacteria bacterium]
MPETEEHPTITAVRQRPATSSPAMLDADWLRAAAIAAGADDVAFVPLDHPDLAEEAASMRRAFPAAHSFVSFVVRMNRPSVQSPLRSIANRTFHDTGERAEHVAAALVRALSELGVDAVHPSMAFPMEMDDFPGRTWVVSHKVVATAAGLGRMGVHRNLIHPRFGNFVLLGTVAVDRPIGEPVRILDYDPCMGCNLCVAACPVGAVRPDGGFDFQACYTHNYREFMGGFLDVLGEVADARNRADLDRRLPVSEGVSLWQSLTYGANYKAAYCMAVCPAGEEVIGPWLDDRKGYVDRTVRPLRDKVETVYVLPGSDAETHVRKRTPHKTVRHVRTAVQPRDIDGFLRFAGLAFQPRKARDVTLRLHFTFTGATERDATIAIADGTLTVLDGHQGERDAHVTVDAATWLGILTGRASPVWAVLRGKLRVSGPIAALDTFQGCFAGVG